MAAALALASRQALVKDRKSILKQAGIHPIEPGFFGAGGLLVSAQGEGLYPLMYPGALCCGFAFFSLRQVPCAATCPIGVRFLLFSLRPCAVLSTCEAVLIACPWSRPSVASPSSPLVSDTLHLLGCVMKDFLNILKACAGFQQSGTWARISARVAGLLRVRPHGASFTFFPQVY